MFSKSDKSKNLQSDKTDKQSDPSSANSNKLDSEKKKKYEDQLKETFDYYDTDKTGILDKDKFIKIMVILLYDT